MVITNLVGQYIIALTHCGIHNNSDGQTALAAGKVAFNKEASTVYKAMSAKEREDLLNVQA